MGGKALKNTATRRYVTRELQMLARKVCEALCCQLPDARVSPVVSYTDKPDHGDLDVVVEDRNAKKRLEPALAAMGVTEVVKNGPVWSLGWGDFQVDLLFQPPEDFHFAERYFAYNDLGNLVGRTAHRMGLKFGHNGLRYVLRDGTCKVAELVLTRDFAEALHFLGYDAQTHADGFDTLQSVFHYAASSPYFDPNAYQVEHLSRASRVRDAKRPTYAKFLSHLQEVECSPGPLASMGRQAHLDRAKARFTEFAAQLEAAERQHEKHQQAKSLFNGSVVASLTGLDGKALGGLMRQLREDVATHSGDFEGWVLSTTDQERAEWVLSHHQAHNPTS